MADLVYDQAKFDELIRRLDENISKLESEKESFEREYEKVKKNWSGTEFNSANENLLEMEKTLNNSIEAQKKQRNYLYQKNFKFSKQTSGFRREVR